MFSSASFILKGSSQSHIVAKTATRDFRLTFYPAQSPRKKTTVFLVGPLRTQGMRLTRPFLNQYPPMAGSLCYSDWPHLGDVPICEFQGHGCEWARVTASCTTWTEMVKEGPPNKRIRVLLLPKGRTNAGLAKAASVHCSAEVEGTSKLLCPRNSATK